MAKKLVGQTADYASQAWAIIGKGKTPRDIGYRRYGPDVSYRDTYHLQNLRTGQLITVDRKEFTVIYQSATDPSLY